MDEEQITVERVVPASSDRIFEVLSNPERHREIDGSGFIRSDAGADRIQGAGDVFTMNMSGDHMDGDYRTENHVTGFDQNRLLAWSTAPEGLEPPGWQWVWVLESQGSDETLVRHTYDWSGVTDQQLRDKVGFPLVSRAQLEDSLARLDQAVTGS